MTSRPTRKAAPKADDEEDVAEQPMIDQEAAATIAVAIAQATQATAQQASQQAAQQLQPAAGPGGQPPQQQPPGQFALTPAMAMQGPHGLGKQNRSKHLQIGNMFTLLL